MSELHDRPMSCAEAGAKGGRGGRGKTKHYSPEAKKRRAAVLAANRRRWVEANAAKLLALGLKPK